MGRDTKVGLFVGLAFIIMFGTILSVRAGAQATEHADLPKGESRDLLIFASTVGRAIDPLLERPARGEPAPRDVVSGPEGRITGQAIHVQTPVEPLEAPPATGPDPAAPLERFYVVRTCDTLAAIAKRVYGDDGESLWRRIYEANRDVLKDPDVVVPGQRLRIPGLAAESAAPAIASAPAERARTVTARELARLVGLQTDLQEAPAPAPRLYTVRKGDTFYRIAERMHGDARLGRLLYLKNKHLVPDATKLKEGQRILLLDADEAGAGSLGQVAAAR